MGSLATDITQVISGEAGPHGKTTYILAAITACFLLASAVWATLFVRYSLRSLCCKRSMPPLQIIRDLTLGTETVYWLDINDEYQKRLSMGRALIGCELV